MSIHYMMLWLWLFGYFNNFDGIQLNWLFIRFPINYQLLILLLNSFIGESIISYINYSKCLHILAIYLTLVISFSYCSLLTLCSMNIYVSSILIYYSVTLICWFLWSNVMIWFLCRVLIYSFTQSAFFFFYIFISFLPFFCTSNPYYSWMF